MRNSAVPGLLPLPIVAVFGLDFSVVLDAVDSEYVSVGEYGWGGAAGTWFWIDPVEDLIFVGMIQQRGGRRPNVRSISHRLTYQAIVETVADLEGVR